MGTQKLQNCEPVFQSNGNNLKVDKRLDAEIWGISDGTGRSASKKDLKHVIEWCNIPWISYDNPEAAKEGVSILRVSNYASNLHTLLLLPCPFYDVMAKLVFGPST